MLLFFQYRIRIEVRDRALWIRAHTQVINVIADLSPAMRRSRWNDDDVADVDDALDDVRADDRAAARRTVEDLRHFAGRARLAAVHHLAAGHERARSGNDDVGLGLSLVPESRR